MQQHFTKQTPAQFHGGFTLVELLVSITIFTVAMLISISTLLVVINANAKSQDLNSVMTNVSYALDSMAREIRTGYEHYCSNNAYSLDTTAFETPYVAQDCTGGTGIIFTNGRTGERMGFKLEDGTIKERSNTYSGTEWLDIISAENVVVSDFTVNVTGTDRLGSGNTEQPQITLIIQGTISTPAGESTAFVLQTVVTKRVLDW